MRMTVEQKERLNKYKSKYHFIYVYWPNLCIVSESTPFDLQTIRDCTSKLLNYSI